MIIGWYQKCILSISDDRYIFLKKDNPPLGDFVLIQILPIAVYEA